jgi:hypothetical protein
VARKVSKTTFRSEVDDIRRRIHELYVSPEGRLAHEAELLRLHAELTRLIEEASDD